MANPNHINIKLSSNVNSLDFGCKRQGQTSQLQNMTLTWEEQSPRTSNVQILGCFTNDKPA
jgi:hypothetical protein